jgi:hypothetical protein
MLRLVRLVTWNLLLSIVIYGAAALVVYLFMWIAFEGPRYPVLASGYAIALATFAGLSLIALAVYTRKPR